MKPRYRIKTAAPNRCLMVHEKGFREYWAPGNGGYVRDVTKNPGVTGQQLFDNRWSNGSTLEWNGTRDFTEMMREWFRRELAYRDRFGIGTEDLFEEI